MSDVFAGYRNQIKRWRMMGLGMNPLGQSYIDKVLGIQSANLIAYWPLNETSGPIADNAEGTVARDGAYTGVTLNSITGPDGANGAPLFDGINDFVNLYSASLNTAYAAPATGTIAIWARVFNVGVWTDGGGRWLFQIGIDGNNRNVFFLPANNTFQYFYQGSGTFDFIDKAGLSDINWMHLAMTWDVGADEMKGYFNGVQEGATQTGIGTIVGNLDNTITLAGAQSTVPATPFHGYLAHPAVWTTALTPAEILELATV